MTLAITTASPRTTRRMSSKASPVTSSAGTRAPSKASRMMTSAHSGDISRRPERPSIARILMPERFCSGSFRRTSSVRSTFGSHTTCAVPGRRHSTQRGMLRPPPPMWTMRRRGSSGVRRTVWSSTIAMCCTYSKTRKSGRAGSTQDCCDWPNMTLNAPGT